MENASAESASQSHNWFCETSDTHITDIICIVRDARTYHARVLTTIWTHLLYRALHTRNTLFFCPPSKTTLSFAFVLRSQSNHADFLRVNFPGLTSFQTQTSRRYFTWNNLISSWRLRKYEVLFYAGMGSVQESEPRTTYWGRLVQGKRL